MNDDLLNAIADAYVYAIKPNMTFEEFLGKQYSPLENEWITTMYRRIRLEQVYS